MSFFGDIIHQNCGAFLYGTAGHTFADFNANPLRYFRKVADLEAEAQLLGTLIQQKNGENFVVNDPLHHLSHTLQQRVKIKRGVEHVRNFNQKRLNINVMRLSRCNHGVHI